MKSSDARTHTNLEKTKLFINYRLIKKTENLRHKIKTNLK